MLRSGDTPTQIQATAAHLWLQQAISWKHFQPVLQAQLFSLFWATLGGGQVCRAYDKYGWLVAAVGQAHGAIWSLNLRACHCVGMPISKLNVCLHNVHTVMYLAWACISALMQCFMHFDSACLADHGTSKISSRPCGDTNRAAS